MVRQSRLFENAAIKVSLARSSSGTPQPEVEIRFPCGTHYRIANAALHALAAMVEAVSPVAELWGVEIDNYSDESGRVWLDLIKADDAETERAFALLQRVVGSEEARREQR